MKVTLSRRSSSKDKQKRIINYSSCCLSVNEQRQLDYFARRQHSGRLLSVRWARLVQSLVGWWYCRWVDGCVSWKTEFTKCLTQDFASHACKLTWKWHSSDTGFRKCVNKISKTRLDANSGMSAYFPTENVVIFQMLASLACPQLPFGMAWPLCHGYFRTLVYSTHNLPIATTLSCRNCLA